MTGILQFRDKQKGLEVGIRRQSQSLSITKLYAN
jgi:hypothetical protein